METPASPFFDSRREVTHHLNRLPHWQQECRLQFVTWHLADALPAEVRRGFVHEQESWLAAHPKPWTDAVEFEFHRLFSDRVNDWLDAGMGSCILQNPDLSQIVLEALLHFDGSKIFMDALAIMPTHVHALFQLRRGHALEQVVHSWKSYTANRLNESLRCTGPVWMKDYWDRMIRSPEHGWKTREYILANPAKARLHPGQYRLWQRNPPLLAGEA
jgi:putative transposase